MHPAHLLDQEDRLVLDLWLAWRGGQVAAASLGGMMQARIPGHLPFGGGVAEQPACLMAAFAVMDAAADLITPVGRGDGDETRRGRG